MAAINEVAVCAGRARAKLGVMTLGGGVVPADPRLELWGRCGTCDRWFYTGLAGKDPVAERCPVCAAPPVEQQKRAVPRDGVA